MKTYVIQLETHDDMISVRDKMDWSKAPRILLVWPRKGHILERGLDLVVLQRHARVLGAQLGLVTSNPDVQANALELGLPVFQNSFQAQRGTWRRGRSRRINLEAYRHKPDVDGLRSQQKQFQPEPVEKQVVRLSAFAVGVMAVLALVMFFLPSARLVLPPARENQSLDLQVWANTTIKTANPSGGLPAVRVVAVVEGADQLSSSGSVSIADREAMVTVEFTSLSGTEVVLPAGTVVMTLDETPIRFVTLENVIIPAGPDQKVKAAAQAQLPGSQGNVAAGAVRAVEGASGLQVLVTNPEAGYGGMNRTSPGPRESDYAELKQRLFSSLEKTALEELIRKVGSGMEVLDGTLQVSSVMRELRDPQPGFPGDDARLSMQVEYSALAVRDEDMQAVGRTALMANLPVGLAPQTNTLQVTFASTPKLDEAGTARWTLHAQQTLESDWSNDAAARQVVGRTPQEAVQMLASSLRLSAPPQVLVSPAWWGRMPFLSFRIQVVRP